MKKQQKKKKIANEIADIWIKWAEDIVKKWSKYEKKTKETKKEKRKD